MTLEAPYHLPWTWHTSEIILLLSCGHERPMDVSERLWDPVAACIQCSMPTEEQVAYPVCKVVERFLTQSWVFDF